MLVTFIDVKIKITKLYEIISGVKTKDLVS